MGISISSISKGALIMNDSARIKILQNVLSRDLTRGQAVEILNVTRRNLI